jgi:peptidoglycan/LPS O-acetylase OafA/YrhL
MARASRCTGMDLLRALLFVFALGNAAGWAALAFAWRYRPEWAERLPLELGTHQRYLKAAPVWARLAAALTGFWTLAAALYLTAGHNTPPFVVIALFTLAAACLIVAIGAAAGVYRALQPEPLPVSSDSAQQAL